MKEPNRREFTKYIVSACLVPKLEIKASPLIVDRDATTTPLVLDILGPFAFRIRSTFVEVWMPFVDTDKYPHEAGIATDTASYVLPQGGDFEIKGPTCSSGQCTVPIPYGVNGCKIYSSTPADYDSQHHRFIYFKLPMPRTIVGVFPVSCEVVPTGSQPTNVYDSYASGLRFLYDMTGTVILTELSTQVSTPIQNYLVQGETQVMMAIRYAPLKYDLSNNNDAKDSFNRVSRLFPKLDLQANFNPAELMSKNIKGQKPVLKRAGPLSDCTPPTLQVG